MFERRAKSSPTDSSVGSPHPNPLPAIPGEGTKRRRFNHTYVVETAWLAAGFISKLLIQMGTLYYLTANLGRDGTGTVFAILGLLACLVPFVQLGNYDLTIRQIARREDPQAVAGRAMRSTVAAFVVFVPVLMILRLVLAKDVGWTAFLLVATGELFVMRVISNVQAVATGFRLHYVAAICDFLLGASRFVAVFVAARLHAGVDAVLTAYAFTAIPAAIAAYTWMVWKIGRPHWRGGSLFTDFADHRRMVIAWFAEMAAGQGDKPLLKSLAGAADVGIYGTAGKLLAVVIVPIDLLTQVFRPRVGTAYADGEAHGRSFGRKMTIVLIGVGAFSGVAMFSIAALLPRVLDALVRAHVGGARLADLANKVEHSQFSDVRIALMYLAIVPPLYGLQRANVITSIARGATSAYATAIALSASAGLIVLALSATHFGWRGACAAYAVFMATSSVALWQLGRRQTPALTTAPDVSADLELAAA